MPHEAETRLFLVVESFRHRHSALMFSKYELLVFRNASIYIFNRDTHEIKENCCRNQVKGSYARACMLFCISGGETIILIVLAPVYTLTSYIFWCTFLILLEMAC